MTSGAGRDRRLAALTLAAVLGAGQGCFQGEWRLGAEVPIATTAKLLPTRSIETWELSHTQTPYVIHVKGTATPRCRTALFGKVRRIDTGKFERVGGNYWLAGSIIMGAAGGALAGFGGAGWLADKLQPPASMMPPPDYYRYALLGVGGGLVVGGLASCISSIRRPAKLRLALCGVLTGLGASVAGGALISGLPSTSAPYISADFMQTLMLAGGGLIGGSIVTGIAGNVWQGYDDRVRSVDLNNAALWDGQQGETTCGQVTALHGRAVGLDIIAEKVQTGLGSEASPLKMRVALGSQSIQPVDLRALRQALAGCGVLRVQLSPDVVYEEFADDYTPPVTPEQMNLATQPIFGRIVPREGLTLSNLEVRQRSLPKNAVVPGISAETLIAVDKHCRGEGPALPAKRSPGAKPGARPTPPLPLPPEQQTPEQPDSREVPDGTPNPPETAPPPPPSALPQEELFFTTPGLMAPRSSPDQSEDGECSLASERARFSDCEAQCSKALSLSPCMLEFRKCYLDSRGSSQVQHDRDQCNLNWEQCLFRATVSPGSWRRCVEGCAQANQPYSCQVQAQRRREGP